MVTPDKDYMLIAIQGPRINKEKRDEENWIIIIDPFITIFRK